MLLAALCPFVANDDDGPSARRGVLQQARQAAAGVTVEGLLSFRGDATIAGPLPLPPPAPAVATVDKSKLAVLLKRGRSRRGAKQRPSLSPSREEGLEAPSVAGEVVLGEEQEEDERQQLHTQPTVRARPSPPRPQPRPRLPASSPAAAVAAIRYLQREELLPVLDAPAQASKQASQAGMHTWHNSLDSHPSPYRSLKIANTPPTHMDTHATHTDPPPKKNTHGHDTPQLPRVLSALRTAAAAKADAPGGEDGAAPEWTAAFRALDDVRRLATHHPTLFSPPQAQRALRDAGRLVDSPRSVGGNPMAAGVLETLSVVRPKEESNTNNIAAPDVVSTISTPAHIHTP